LWTCKEKGEKEAVSSGGLAEISEISGETAARDGAPGSSVEETWSQVKKKGGGLRREGQAFHLSKREES